VRRTSAASASRVGVFRIFTRLGSADYLAAGASTFMVEMLGPPRSSTTRRRAAS
jgi:hypothetical protein